MKETIRWGILATGSIAKQFAEGLAIVPGAELLAVGSRTREKADRFGDTYAVPRRYGSYEELAADPDLDVIYVATPHSFHHRDTLLCLSAGKAVLCEKAFALNAGQAREMVELARQRKLFLMEAMWNRFNPVVLEAQRLVAEGAIGELRMLVADFGIGASFDPTSRLFDPALGGGALLDLGVYPVALASLFLGSPSRISTQAHLGETGVDERAGIVFGYDDEKIAVLHTSLRERTPSDTVLFGSGGNLRIHGPIFRPEAITVTRGHSRGQANPQEEIRPPLEGNAYNYEAIEVMRCLREGKLESPGMSLEETLSIMETMDAIRRAWGMRYPDE